VKPVPRFTKSVVSAAAPPCVLIPVKSPALGKSRLAVLLGERSRRALSLMLLRRSLRVATLFAGAERCVVVSHSEEVLRLAQRRGLQTIREAGHGGLNAAVEQALASLRRDGEREFLVMATDLPCLRPQDLASVVALGRFHACPVVAADRHGSGTNLLFLPVGVRFPLSYGLGSLQRHVAAGERAAGQARVYRSAQTAFDIDTPEDLCRWRSERASPQVVQACGVAFSLSPDPAS
jgi:2-phospho-L-lactate guanylyltransferase